MPDMDHQYVFDFDAPPDASGDERTSLLGGKGANLAVMAHELELPVPPGFTVTTEACRAFLSGAWPHGLDEELRVHMTRLGERVGRTFGDERDPLLVSVRSGAAASMPGMMDTILDLGLTEASMGGLARAPDDEAFAADCRRRLADGWRAVIGPESVPDDPWDQLRAATEAVFRSWNSDRARAYRRREGIPDDLGTAVTVQAMVFGNRGEDSGTGVLFTRNPSTGENALYGDVMFDAQGEDVVAGGHEPQPLAVLDERLPEVAAELRRHATTLEHHYADLCDIEFTIEQGRLWLLQVRVGKRSPRGALRIATEMAADPDFPLSRAEAVARVAAHLADPPREFIRTDDAQAPIASGLPASPGVASGVVALTSTAAEAAAAEGRDVILVRADTSPEDVPGMARSVGVLTARGGLASHAAVVARGWGIPAVVGAADVRPDDHGVEIAGTRFAAGDIITIDGGSGKVYAGHLDGTWRTMPEVEQLRAWADELGIAVGEPESGSTARAVSGDADIPPPSADDVLHALLVRGSATAAQLAETLLVDESALAPLVAAADDAGLTEATADGLRLTAEGKSRAAELVTQDRSDVGDAAGPDLLEAFHAFDERMKEIVTAWQLREVNGEQTLNDHTDAEYDAGVLDDLATLHDETVAWLMPLAGQLRRFAAYRSRLGRALELARGDQRFVASPRVDSFHSIWFELHEDLIRLAGRSREEEAAAGRA